MLRQYEEQKAQHRDAVLFFRMGDFYEMFRSDAVEISRLLNLTLTQRQGIPMCGIPYHAAGNYIARLLRLGKKIAICEQIELAPDGRGLARREVVEVITPGTVVDDAYLNEHSNNYLAALGGPENQPAFACIDLSTGEFRATELEHPLLKDSLRRELAKTNPREMIVQQSLLESENFSFLIDDSILLNCIPDWSFDLADAEKRLKTQFGTISLKSFGMRENDPRVLVAGAILEYLADNHQSILPHVSSITCYDENDYVGLDESTIRNLEIVKNLQDGGMNYTLLEVLNHTKTSTGTRLLRRKLLQPSPNADFIKKFHDRVECIYRNQMLLSQLRRILSGIQDIERLAARTSMDRAHAKDLMAICHSLKKVLQINEILEPHLWNIDESRVPSLFKEGERLSQLLSSSLLDDPSILLTEGRLIREGWNSEVDRLRSFRDAGRSHLDNYTAEEKSATGLSSLKVKYNRILGYFIEVSRNQAQNAPERFRSRQSLTQVVRFSTPRLEELETEILSVDEKLVNHEREVFLEIRNEVKKSIPMLLEIARLTAEIDLVQSYAHAATEYGYVRPEIREDIITDIKGGRHPVVERHLPQGDFVPNSIMLSGEGISFAMVTGPNMAGKSTVLRQVALITLMAQAGSFVPADSAVIGIADRIFCRVGASDNLARGESTFLVEMNETANILRNATSCSLVIMDEVGRGTGTDDGLAIAQAVCEYLLEYQCPRTMFATHYRELTAIVHKRLVNLSMAVHETKGKIVFPKQLVQGAAKSSYGIHAAALAGIPEQVVRRARELLLNENTQTTQSGKDHTPMLFDPRDLVLDALVDIDINELTPLDALQQINRWKMELETH